MIRVLLSNGFLYPPSLCRHPSHTPVTNSPPIERENEEPLIGFEVEGGRTHRLPEDSVPQIAINIPGFHMCSKVGKPGDLSNCKPPSARDRGRSLGQTGSKGGED